MYLVLFVILIIGLLWLFQVVLLDDFYRYFKTRMVNSSGEILAQNMETRTWMRWQTNCPTKIPFAC